jgi:hypothetical protein
MSGNVHNCDLERLYAIRHQPPEVFTPGRNTAGEQLLVGTLNDDLLVAIQFSPEGRYLQYRLHPVIRVPDPNSSETATSQLSRIHQEALEEFIQLLGMVPGDICIRHFAFPDWGIGIAEWYLCDFPDYQRSMEAGATMEDERLLQWQRERHWVLHWGMEIEMSNDGEVLST